MNFFRRLFFIGIIVVSATMAEVPSCRTFKPGMTVCSPYNTPFLKITKLKRGVEQLRHQPITKKEIPITEKIRVRNGMTLNSLISKYIKREERLYYKAEKKRLEKISQVKRAEKTKPKIKPIVEPKSQAEMTESTESKPLPVQKPKKILVEKTALVEENKTIQIEPEKTPKTIVLNPVIEAPIKPSTIANDNNTTKDDISTEEMILPAELIPVGEEPPKDIKQEIKEEFAVYVVKKGDSLLGIAKRFGIDTTNLAKINHLKKKQVLRVAQKLRIPLSQELADTLDNAFYIVKKGDTLSSIAKQFNIKIRDLKKYNKIKKRSVIHIGQGLVLPLPHKLVQLKRIEEKKKKERLRKKRERERLARIALKKAQRARFLKASKGLKHKLSVTATAYTSHRGQTDKTPFLAAWNNRIRPGMKVIAVSRDLIYKYGITNGSKVRISGLPGIYTVRDKMNKRWRRKIDIYMGTSRWRALRWGRRRVTLYY
jgi:LysM repeat protein